MNIFSLFELFLVGFSLYAVIAYQGITRILLALVCLVTVFLLERLQKRIEEDEEVRERLIRYKRQEIRKKIEERQKEQEAEEVVSKNETEA